MLPTANLLPEGFEPVRLYQNGSAWTALRDWGDGTVTHLTFDEQGRIRTEQWTTTDGALHRVGKPAVIEYSPDGTVSEEQWFVHNRCHRDDGPAIILWSSTGVLMQEQWFREGRPERDGNAPQIVWYDEDGVVEEQWVINGRRVSRREALTDLMRRRGFELSPRAIEGVLDRPWQEWADISDAEIELAMTLYPNFTEA